MSIDQSSTAVVTIERKVKELENVNRLVGNTLNLINDIEIKGAYAGPVAEIQGWLTGFKSSVTTQIDTLKATLPKVEEQVIETVAQVSVC